jgi:hypothetical protein
MDSRTTLFVGDNVKKLSEIFETSSCKFAYERRIAAIYKVIEDQQGFYIRYIVQYGNSLYHEGYFVLSRKATSVNEAIKRLQEHLYAVS